MFGVTSTSIVLLTITLLSPVIEAQPLNMASARNVVLTMMNYLDTIIPYDNMYNEVNADITYHSPDLEALKAKSLGILNMNNIRKFISKAKKQDMREAINKYEDDFKNLLTAAGLDLIDDNIPMESYLQQLRSASGKKFGLDMRRASYLVTSIMNYLDGIIPYGSNYNPLNADITFHSPDLATLKNNSVRVLGSSNVENFKEAAKENDMRAVIDKYIRDFTKLLEEAGVAQTDDNIPMMSYLTDVRAESETAFSS